MVGLELTIIVGLYPPQFMVIEKKLCPVQYSLDGDFKENLTFFHHHDFLGGIIINEIDNCLKTICRL
jgi:hypothetical protein